MTALLPKRFRGKHHRIMVFVDGENLAIRYGSELGEKNPPDHVSYLRDSYVWSDILDKALEQYELVRTFYYTTATGDDSCLLEIEDKLRKLRIDSPVVFKKGKKDKKSKQVDIALVTDLLKHAYHNNYDIAILVSGDQDFVPAVQAVTDFGKTVVLWYTHSGVSESLRRAANFSFDLSQVLLEDDSVAWGRVFHGKT